MNKFLSVLDAIITETLPYLVIITASLVATKALGYSNYSWLAAGSPAILAILIIGIVNFLSIFAERD